MHVCLKVLHVYVKGCLLWQVVKVVYSVSVMMQCIQHCGGSGLVHETKICHAKCKQILVTIF